MKENKVKGDSGCTVAEWQAGHDKLIEGFLGDLDEAIVQAVKKGVTPAEIAGLLMMKVHQVFGVFGGEER